MQNQPTDISSPVVNPQEILENYKDIYYQLEQILGADAGRVKAFVQQGIITEQQGAYLMTKLGETAQKINLIKQQESYNNSPERNQRYVQQTQVQEEQPDAMTLFNNEQPGFFETAGRGDILNYIKGFDMDKDEIAQIAKLVEGLEKSAVDNYLKKSAYEKSLNDENALAKSKLTAYAQNSSSDGNFNKIFTREEIGRMSGEEFTKNEKAIMQQLKQGMIK